MFKKLFVLFLAFAFILAPNGGLLGHDEASAKARYKSGTKSFTPSKSDTQMNSTVKKQAPASTSQVKKTPSPTASKGGFMKGLLFGGLAGLMFGSLFSNLGALGALLGFIVNALAIGVLVMLAIRLFRSLKKPRKQTWER